jgi:hypothetical protein
LISNIIHCPNPCSLINDTVCDCASICSPQAAREARRLTSGVLEDSSYDEASDSGDMHGGGDARAERLGSYVSDVQSRRTKMLGSDVQLSGRGVDSAAISERTKSQHLWIGVFIFKKKTHDLYQLPINPHPPKIIYIYIFFFFLYIYIYIYIYIYCGLFPLQIARFDQEHRMGRGR